MMAGAKVRLELVVRDVTALSGRGGMHGLLLFGMLLPFRLHLVAGLVLIAFLILLFWLVLFGGFGVVLMRRFSFVLLGLRLGIFLPRRFLGLVVLRVKNGCTSHQHRQYRYIQKPYSSHEHPPRPSLMA